MKFYRIIRLAKSMKIADAERLSEKELIRAIQIKEGNQPCFDTGKVDCDQQECWWWENCIKENPI